MKLSRSNNSASFARVALKIAQASLNQTGLDWARNLNNHMHAIDQAVSDKADILCFPELSLTGYDNQDNAHEFRNKPIHEALQLLANYAAGLNPNLMLSVGHPWRLSESTCDRDRLNNPIFNVQNKPFTVQSVISGGQILAMHPKRFLYDYDRGYEGRNYIAWSDKHADEYQGQLGAGFAGCIPIQLPALPEYNAPSVIIPFGSAVIQFGDAFNALNMTTLICEEYWKATRFDHKLTDNALFSTDGLLAKKANDFHISLAINPNASPPSLGKYTQHLELCALHTAYCDVIVHTDELGSSGATYASYGSQIIAAGNGTIVSQGIRASFKNVSYSSQVVDVPVLPVEQKKPHAFVPHAFSNDHTPGVNNQGALWDRPDNPYRLLEESIRIECLWLFDYMVKNKLPGFTQAMSGGADSAYNAAKVRIMLNLAINELGLDATLAKIAQSSRYAEQVRLIWNADTNSSESPNREQALDVIMEQILTCVTMPTKNNSEETKEAARSMIQGGIREDGSSFRGVGGQFYTCHVDPLVTLYAQVYAGVNADGLTPDKERAISEAIKRILYLRAPNTSSEQLSAQVIAVKNAFEEISHATVLSLANPAHQLAYENLQARIRSTLIWIFSNVENKAGIANPNLDEICNGYTSYAGDEHAGGIGGNAHKNKHDQLLEMQQLMERGLDGVPPIEGFYGILKQTPSAELQPKDDDGQVIQSDEDSLGRSYEQTQLLTYWMLHDEPEYGCRLTPIEVFERTKTHPAFNNCSIEQRYEKVRATYAYWANAQFKIHAGAVAFTGQYSVDHQVSKRTPNIGAYRRPELAQLTLHCLNEMANKDGVTFAQLAGIDLKTGMNLALYDEATQGLINSTLWNSVTKKIDLQHLYGCVRQGGKEVLFPKETAFSVKFFQATSYTPPAQQQNHWTVTPT